MKDKESINSNNKGNNSENKKDINIINISILL